MTYFFALKKAYMSIQIIQIVIGSYIDKEKLKIHPVNRIFYILWFGWLVEHVHVHDLWYVGTLQSWDIK